MEALTFIKNLSNNQVFAGLIGVWGMGIATYLMRNIPAKIWGFLVDQLTTSIVFDNSGWFGNERLFRAYLEWAQAHTTPNMTRNLMVESSAYGASKTAIGPGYGSHLFTFEGRLFWASLKKNESSVSERVIKTVTITTYGRSHAVFTKLVDAFRPLSEEDDAIRVFKFDAESKNWQPVAVLQKRALESVAMNADVRSSLITAINRFQRDREWYLEKGIPHKLGVLLYGQPGTGKTSIVKALATHFNRAIYALNIRQMTDATLATAFANVPRGSFILVEDFDDSPATKKRQGLSSLPSMTHGSGDIKATLEAAPSVESIVPPPASPVAFTALSLAGFLNTIDGIISLDDCIIFNTTNDISSIDPAVLRKGRCDIRVEIPLLQNAEVAEYVKFIYGQSVPLRMIFKEIAGCDLQALVLEHTDSFPAFLAAAIEKGYATCV